MAEYEITDETKITFHDLYRGKEEDGLILVGRQDIASYVSLPAEALEIIDLLDSGKTVGQVRRILEEKYGEEAEIEEFIEDMIGCEMVRNVDGSEIATTSKEQKALFNWITARHVGWMFSTFAWVVYSAAAVLCLAIFALVPDYIPVPQDLFFHPLYSVAVAFMFFFGWVLVAVHEVAHLFAAKYVGTEGSFSLSHRLIFIVAQTNLGNIWTVPRKKRYTVYFAGMAWDAVMVLICLVLLLGSDKGFLTLPEISYKFVKAIVFLKVWGIIWQFRFNMQTDIYYAVTTYFKCRNLLNDAQTYIKNATSRFITMFKRADMSDIPANEMRAIKWYSLFYFVGTFVTLATYFLRDMPLLWIQVKKAFYGLTAGYTVDPSGFADGVVLIALNIFNFGLLGYFIIKPRWGKLKQLVRPASA